jgi:hypothetical protein
MTEISPYFLKNGQKAAEVDSIGEQWDEIRLERKAGEVARSWDFSGHQWVLPVTLATCETEIRRFTV